MIVVDTNVISELMNATPSRVVVDWMDQLSQREVATTAVTMSEILYGIGSLPDGRRKHALLEGASRLFTEEFSGRILSFDADAAVEYATIVVERDRQGNPISMADAQIASICRAGGHTLATRNTHDFTNIGLRLINPWQA